MSATNCAAWPDDATAGREREAVCVAVFDESAVKRTGELCFVEGTVRVKPRRWELWGWNEDRVKWLEGGDRPGVGFFGVDAASDPEEEDVTEYRGQ